VISSYAYTFDNVGNRLTMTDNNSKQTIYEYDDLYRLTKVTYPSGKIVEYTYDAAGNRTEMKINNDTTVNYFYDDENRLLSYSSGAETTVFQYDNNGNMIYKATGGETYNLTFDIENRMLKVQRKQGRFSRFPIFR